LLSGRGLEFVQYSTHPFDFKFLMLGTLTFLSASAGTPAAKHPSMPDILAASPPADRRELDLDNTQYLEVPEVGFSEGFPVARSPHCYGMVGVGSDHSS
jgi:hypothetical protein